MLKAHTAPKDVGFLALRKELLSIIPYLVPKKSCVSIVRNEDGEKVGFAFDCVSFSIWWLIRLVIMSRQGHGLYIASVAIAWWMHRCICLLSRTHSLKKLLYWCESLFLGAVVCIRRGVHIEGESASLVFRERISHGLLPDPSFKLISPIVKAFDVLLIQERSWLLWHREQVFVLDWKLWW